MGQIVVNVGSFDLTSNNGNTAYSTTRYFTIPANNGITSCVATFATHVNTGSFQGKAFFLNSVQAHPNTPWPTSGIALNAALLSAGQNAFRAAVKSQAGLSARWSIGDIYLTIDYVDPSGGGGGNIGAVTINKTSLTAGDTITVSASACDAIYSRSIYLMLADNTVITNIEINFGTAAKSWTVTVPESLCASYAADSETLIIKAYMEVYQTGTYVGSDAKNFTMQVPASAVPTIGAFTAALNSNGVDASITKYVQNYSKVNLAMGSVAGALGSIIASYEITGGGFSAAASSATMGPFGQTGDITFTAKVTDSRGRTATRTVTINVLAYTPVSGVNIAAYRSDASKAADDEGAYASLRGKMVYSSLDSENAAVIKGRVYEKDTTAPSWTTIADDTLTLFGGSLSEEKGYTAEISINDKITSVVYVIQIPTAIVGIHITPGATGGGFGMYGQPNRWDFHKPVYANDVILTSTPNPNILHNPDFRNPVNQRGVSGAISTGAYFVDRWIRNSGTVTVNSGYLTMESGAVIEQRIEGLNLAGATVTASVNVGSNVYSGKGVFPTSVGTVDVTLTGFGTATLGYNNAGYMILRFTASGSQNVEVVKLELGTGSTLRLDPPMDHAVELAKCQRFFLPIPLDTKFIGTAPSASVAFLWAELRLAIPMRIAPTTSAYPQFSSVVGTSVAATSTATDYTSTTQRIVFVIPTSVYPGVAIAELKQTIALSSEL